jgi:hypothetical protein
MRREPSYDRMWYGPREKTAAMAAGWTARAPAVDVVVDVSSGKSRRGLAGWSDGWRDVWLV